MLSCEFRPSRRPRPPWAAFDDLTSPTRRHKHAGQHQGSPFGRNRSSPRTKRSPLSRDSLELAIATSHDSPCYSVRQSSQARCRVSGHCCAKERGTALRALALIAVSLSVAKVLGLSRKASENYRSAGVSINPNAEPDQLLLARPEDLKRKIDDSHDQAQGALGRQAGRSAQAAAPVAPQPAVPAGPANGWAGRAATAGNKPAGRARREAAVTRTITGPVRGFGWYGTASLLRGAVLQPCQIAVEHAIPPGILAVLHS
jgi:hypothetical protein